MSSLYEISTKEKIISYKQRRFIKGVLRQLSINPQNNGLYYLKR